MAPTAMVFWGEKSHGAAFAGKVRLNAPIIEI
jgi:hypothetical protein